jgi:hypothetical protein
VVLACINGLLLFDRPEKQIFPRPFPPENKKKRKNLAGAKRLLTYGFSSPSYYHPCYEDGKMALF